MVHGDTDSHYTTTNVYDNNTWLHFTSVYDGSNADLYINSALDRTVFVTGIIGSSGEVLKVGQDGYGNWFNGVIDELRVSSTNRSSAWIKATYYTSKDNLLTFGTLPVSYTYDSTSGSNYGKGLRTGMTDAAGTNAYKYDTRGRLIEEKRTIDAVDYTTSYSYYGTNQIYQITYPTAEVVTNAYNGRGLPYGLSYNDGSNHDLVTSVLYNQLGAMTQINLNNGLRTNFGYWGLDHETSSYGKLWEIKTLPQAGGRLCRTYNIPGMRVAI